MKTLKDIQLADHQGCSYEDIDLKDAARECIKELEKWQAYGTGQRAWDRAWELADKIPEGLKCFYSFDSDTPFYEADNLIKWITHFFNLEDD